MRTVAGAKTYAKAQDVLAETIDLYQLGYNDREIMAKLGYGHRKSWVAALLRAGMPKGSNKRGPVQQPIRERVLTMDAGTCWACGHAR